MKKRNYPSVLLNFMIEEYESMWIEDDKVYRSISYGLILNHHKYFKVGQAYKIVESNNINDCGGSCTYWKIVKVFDNHIYITPTDENYYNDKAYSK